MDAYAIADALEDLITELIAREKGEDTEVGLYKQKLVKALYEFTEGRK